MRNKQKEVQDLNPEEVLKSLKQTKYRLETQKSDISGESFDFEDSVKSFDQKTSTNLKYITCEKYVPSKLARRGSMEHLALHFPRLI